MAGSGRGGGGWVGVGVLVVAMAQSGPAHGQVTQPDATQTPLPQPVASAESSLVNASWAWSSDTDISQDPTGANLNPTVKYGSYYAPPKYPQFVTGDAISLGGLFKWRKEPIDPVSNASTGPGYFSGKCGFSGQILLHGSSCQVKLGWYNVTDPASKTPPNAAEIYPFVDDPASSLSCTQEDGVSPKADGLCPLAWDNVGPRQLTKKRWLPKSFSSGDLSKDPRYKGGFIAFAMIGAATGNCPQSKFSMYEHNQRNVDGKPWITSIVYQSRLDSGGFYFAFEDAPMPASDWKASGADGDFNDEVFYVSGLSCTGGNQACDTGLFGQCSLGRTTCVVDGQPSLCRPVQTKSVEVCDNVDNDCDGMIDNGNALCPDTSKPNCFKGACVASCKNGAFTCPSGSACDADGQCADACTAVSCAPGSACRNGQCVNEPCANITCAFGTRCELGQCVDPCAGVTCAGDRVCDRGLCVDNCSCAGCDTGLTCGANGHCIDSACASKTCPAGQTCLLGACVDPCFEIVCPNGGKCIGGSCPALGSSGSGGAGAASLGGGFGTNAGSGSSAHAGENGDAGTASGAAPGHGAGGAGNGLAGTQSAGSGQIAGGEKGEGGMNSRAGAANTAGGEPTSSSPAVSSSSCGYAAPSRTSSQPALPLLGLALGAALARRRTHRLRNGKRSPASLD